MPCRIGITAERCADRSQWAESPCPSEPSTRATFSRPATASSIGAAPSVRVRATVVKPCAATCGRASYQSGRRVHGSAKTAPMATLTERR